MGKRKRQWIYIGPKPPEVLKPIASDGEQAAVERRCGKFIASILAPKFVKPLPKKIVSATLVKLSGRWKRGYFYFLAHYQFRQHCDTKHGQYQSHFSRLEYLGKDKFNLAYLDYNGKWCRFFSNISLENCLQAIVSEPLFSPRPL